MMVIKHTEIQNFINDYDLIISDIFGVIHNGVSLLPNADDFFKKHANKIVLLTNDGRQVPSVISFLSELGVDKGLHYKDIYTSGFFLNEYFKSFESKPYKCFIFEQYTSPSPGCLKIFDQWPNISFTNNPHEADFCFIAGLLKLESLAVEDNHVIMQDLKVLLNKQCNMVCPNPDKFVVYGEKDFLTLAGLVAETYQNMGGNVISFGKPAKYPYETVLKQYPAKKAVMIGDTLDTDILGANQVGIDSILITTGVSNKQWQQHSSASFDHWLAKQAIQPTWVVDSL